MKQAVEHDPVQFPVEGGLKNLGILANPLYTDIDLPYDPTGFCTIGKGDDVGEVVVLEKVPIDAKQVGIITKDIDQGVHIVLLLPGQFIEERFQRCPVTQGRHRLGKKEADIRHDGPQK
jgi:hypothetical protein